MVEEAWAYPWSSASFHLGQREEDLLVRDRTLMGLVNDWEEFLSRSSSKMHESIRRLTRAGRPAGDTVFIGLVERLVGRNLSKGKPGRPAKERSKPR